MKNVYSPFSCAVLKFLEVLQSLVQIHLNASRKVYYSFLFSGNSRTSYMKIMMKC